jgi:tRNA threonylcarbamoyladenosine biosynthesis protein TsaB
MPYILCIETSGINCSVGIFDGDKLLHCAESKRRNSHAELLNIYIEECLQASGISAIELDAVAISKGPGSYTGLRIGTSTAKGLCYGLNIPLVSVDTLLSMALAVNNRKEYDFICPMLDARRMEVYTCLVDPDLNKTEETQALIVDENSLQHLKDKKVAFLGDGSDKCKDLLSHLTLAEFIEDVFPSAQFMGKFANDSFETKEFEDVAYFVPFYLKDFIAGKPKNLLKS